MEVDVDEDDGVVEFAGVGGDASPGCVVRGSSRQQIAPIGVD